jgi:hypothetical protein
LLLLHVHGDNNCHPSTKKLFTQQKVKSFFVLGK